MTAGDFVVYQGEAAPEDGGVPAAPLEQARAEQFDVPGQVECHVDIWWVTVNITEETLAKCEISGGRSDHMSQPDVATVSLTVEWRDELALPSFGDPLEIAGWLPGRKDTTYAALFSGNITDIAVEGDSPRLVSIVAADPMRRLDGVYIGDTPWPNQWWHERIWKVWEAARAKMHTPQWMPARPHNTFFGGIAPSTEGMVWARDVDHQPALQLLYDYLDPVRALVFHRPDTHWPSPPIAVTGGQWDNPWTPTVEMRSGLDAFNGWSEPRAVIHECLIEDTPPRRWQNYGTVINEWQVRYKGSATPEQPDEHPDREVIATADQSIRNRYGPRRASTSTELVDQVGGQPVDYAHDLAYKLLARTSRPAWSLDNVTVVFDPVTTAGLSDKEILDAWAIVAQGPSQMARYVNLGGIPSGANNAWDPNPGGGWVVENTKIVWTEDGWDVQLGCSHPSVYAGTVGGNTELRFEVDQPIPASGATIWVQVYYLADRTSLCTADEGTLTVNSEAPVPLRGLPRPPSEGCWTAVDSGQVGVDGRITVEFHPAYAGTNGSTATQTVTVSRDVTVTVTGPADTRHNTAAYTVDLHNTANGERAPAGGDITIGGHTVPWAGKPVTVVGVPLQGGANTVRADWAGANGMDPATGTTQTTFHNEARIGVWHPDDWVVGTKPMIVVTVTNTWDGLPITSNDIYQNGVFGQNVTRNSVVTVFELTGVADPGSDFTIVWDGDSLGYGHVSSDQFHINGVTGCDATWSQVPQGQTWEQLPLSSFGFTDWCDANPRPSCDLTWSQVPSGQRWEQLPTDLAYVDWCQPNPH